MTVFPSQPVGQHTQERCQEDPGQRKIHHHITHLLCVQVEDPLHFRKDRRQRSHTQNGHQGDAEDDVGGWGCGLFVYSFIEVLRFLESTEITQSYI